MLIRLEILCAGFERDFHYLVFIRAIAWHHELALSLKQP